MSVPKSKTVNYRHVEFEPADGDHLQKLITDKLGVPNQSVDMSLTAASDSPHYVLHTPQTRKGALCGELLRFESGKHIRLVGVDTATGKVWTGTVPPVDSDGTRRDYADQALYFALKENHLAVIQSMGFGLGELQSFFQWLLGIDLPPPGHHPRLFHFRNVPSLKARQTLHNSEISGINIGSKLFHESKISEVVEQEGKKPRTINRTEYLLDASTRAILSSLMDRLGLKSSPILEDLDHHADPGSIRMNLSITYASRSQKDAQELMHALAGSLDNGDFPKASIRLKGGRKIEGEAPTIIDSIKVQTVSGNMVVDDALRAVTDWLLDQIKEGKLV